ncbi:MAG: hypothetical protein FJW94_04770 [Actinobacteria bacterium]|nr:hypothetical protein [Actinomycetota bacterium]
MSKIDPASDTVTATVPVGSGPYGMAFGAESNWVAIMGSDTVSRINPG